MELNWGDENGFVLGARSRDPSGCCGGGSPQPLPQYVCVTKVLRTIPWVVRAGRVVERSKGPWE